MSRLTDLIAQLKNKDRDLGKEIEREFKVLATRRSFGLNFERHQPEKVELPGRPVRKGDKVRILARRHSLEKGDQRSWRVLNIESLRGKRIARLELVGSAEIVKRNAAIEDLVVIADFRDYIYPSLVSTGKVQRSSGKPYHILINGENYHALEALTFTHRGRIDVIYIDPPYNSGATDWKYNNDYVEKDDMYRHSKWLAFMERRLIVAKQLLNSECSALVCTIDEKEYLHLEARIQMISSVINAKGIIRYNDYSLNKFFLKLEFR